MSFSVGEQIDYLFISDLTFIGISSGSDYCSGKLYVIFRC